MTLRSWYQIHKWTSLVCTIFMLLLCVTGLPLIFSEEIDHALGNSVEAPELRDGSVGQADVDAIVADALRRHPGQVAQFLVADPHEPDLLFVRLADRISAAEPSAFLTYDVRTGDYLSAYPLDSGFMTLMLRLHVDMFAGLPGTLFLGAMGLLLLGSLISGAVIYGPYMRKLPFGTVRRQRASRLKWLDQHNLLGIVTLVWFIVVGATGVINTLNVPIFEQWQRTELASLAEPFRQAPAATSSASVGAALRSAQAAEPTMSLSFMAYPGNDFSTPAHFMAFMQGSTDITAKLLKIVMIDANSGQVVASRHMPWYVSALMLSQPLHFGDYGGLGLKIIWAVLDLLTIVVLVGGLVLWWQRRASNLPVELGASVGRVAQ